MLDLPVVGVASNKCQSSQWCPLSNCAKSIAIPGKGGLSPKVLVITESPNRSEDDNNELMLGDSADLFLTTIQKVGIKPEDIYYTALTKCISFDAFNSFSGKIVPPPDNAVQICASTHLQYEIQRLKSTLKYVILCGKTVTKLFLPSLESGILSVAGNEYQCSLNLPDGSSHSLTVIPIPSSTYVMMNFSYYDKFLQILQNISNKLYGIADISSSLKSRVIEPHDFLDYTVDLISRYQQKRFSYISFDIETKSLEWNIEDNKIIGFCFADPETREGVFVGLEHPDLFITPEQQDLIRSCTRKILRTIPLIGHNIIFDIKWCHQRLDIPLNQFKIHGDTLYLGYYIFGARRDSGIDLNLKDLSRLVLGFDTQWEDELHQELKEHRLKKDRHFFNVRYNTISKYGAMDAIVTLLLFEQLSIRLEEYNDTAYRFLLRSIPVFAELETLGIQIDWSQREFLMQKYTENIEFLRSSVAKLPTVSRFIDAKIANKQKFEFNPNSLLQLQEIFFSPEYLHTPVFESTEKGKPSVAESSLQMIINSEDSRVLYEAKKLATIISNLRGYVKILSTYLEPLSEPEFIHPTTGLYLPDYNVIGTATGRLSSYFHTLPSGNTDVKRLVSSRFATSGGLVMAADYSQLEVRVIGALANDTGFISAYQEGLDVHALTASRIFSKPVEQISKKERKSAKAVVFGILYGKQSKSLSEELGISIEEAQSYIDYFFKGFPNVRQWISAQHKFLRKTKYVSTPFGRRRWLRSIDSKQKFEVLKSEREAQNSPIQSTACFVGSSIIPLSSGEYIQIKDLVGKEEFWVYSYRFDGTIVPGRGHSARKTKTTDIICEVKLDTGETIYCTPDHLFLLRSGVYCEAQSLKIDESLMSLRLPSIESNHQLQEIKVISVLLKQESHDVYDISVDDYHNFAISSGVFVHNSDLTFDATLRIQEDIWDRSLKSRLIGTVHDSIEIDVYPGELTQIYDLFKYHMETVPEAIYPWLNGMPLKCDTEIGLSWGGACEVEIKTLENETFVLEGSGFDQDLKAVINQLSLVYNVQILETEESFETIDSTQQFIHSGNKLKFKLQINKG
jgi:uracil-DNA glycosylase family 4